eukprot:GHVP01050700.1.p1 GENE.GHVP01050700.1~~GHVP01050700.1.p1  ORF type:complete len:568 (+),score=84.89 GHVP01050700.1:59-1762(+)
MAALTPYLWSVIFGFFAMSFMAFGIGANDVANNIGTTVGSKSLKLHWACLLAAIGEFVGAAFLGASVTDSVRKGIVDATVFSDRPDILLFGNLSALMAAGMWLFLATMFSLPVSTTHSIIGALLGFGIATGEEGVVDWTEIFKIIGSWIFSPALAGILGAVVFALTRAGILRREDPIRAGYRTLWLLVTFFVLIFSMFFILKTPITLSKVSCVQEKGGVSIAPCKVSAWATANPGPGFGVILAITLVGTLIFAPIAYWYANVLLRRYDAEHGSPDSVDAVDSVKKPPQISTTISVRSDVSGKLSTKNSGDIEMKSEYDEDESTDDEFHRTCSKQKIKEKWYSMPWFADIVDDELQRSKTAERIHFEAEVFDGRTEQFFCLLQIVGAVADTVVHGSNDVANAVAPFSTIFSVYKEGVFLEQVATPLWILVVGGLSIAAGVMILGANVIRTIGVKLCKISPSRGFSITVGTALTVVIGSILGIPLSTTHCQVGSTVGVALIDTRKNFEPKCWNLGFLDYRAVNGWLLLKICVSWVLTLILAAAASATIFSFFVYSPTMVYEYYEVKEFV